MVQIQNIYGTNQTRLLQNTDFWWLKRTNHVKLTEEYVRCIKKQVLVKKKMYISGWDMGLLLRA